MSVTLNGTSGLVFSDGTIQGTAGAMAFRNRIINGDMRVDQRNVGTTVTGILNGAYSVDRYIHYHTIATLNSGQNLGSITPPTGFTNYLGLAVTTAASPGSTDYCNIQQWIEGYNVADLAWGTAAAKAATVSFWVRSSLTGTYGCYIMSGSGAPDNTYNAQFTISSANTWQYVTFTVPGLTTANTASKTNGRSVGIGFDLGNGSSFRTGTLNAWGGSTQGTSGNINWCATSGATFQITGLQFEKAAAATDFEHRPYATELAMCQRYYYQAGAFFGGYTITVGSGLSAGSTNIWRCNVALPVPMRATPSVTETNMDVWSSVFGSHAVAAIGTIYYLNGQIYFEVDLTTTESHGITPGYPVLMQTKGSGGKSSIEIIAEL